MAKFIQINNTIINLDSIGVVESGDGAVEIKFRGNESSDQFDLRLEDETAASVLDYFENHADLYKII